MQVQTVGFDLTPDTGECTSPSVQPVTDKFRSKRAYAMDCVHIADDLEAAGCYSSAQKWRQIAREYMAGVRAPDLAPPSKVTNQRAAALTEPSSVAAGGASS